MFKRLYPNTRLRDYARNNLISKTKSRHFVIGLVWGFWHLPLWIHFLFNSYLFSKHPDWEFLDIQMKFNDNPLGIRQYINHFTWIHFGIYLFIANALLFNQQFPPSSCLRHR